MSPGTGRRVRDCKLQPRAVQATAVSTRLEAVSRNLLGWATVLITSCRQLLLTH